MSISVPKPAVVRLFLGNEQPPTGFQTSHSLSKAGLRVLPVVKRVDYQDDRCSSVWNWQVFSGCLKKVDAIASLV